jgi:ABC-type nitrate/sulfonate/bicarbonate transport system permease component
MATTTRQRAEAILLPLLGIVVVLAAFEIAPRVGVLPRQSFPPVSEILTSLVDLIASGELWNPVVETFDGWARAMLIAAVIAIPVGMLMGASKTGALAMRLPVEFLRPIPSVALIPVLILLYGPQGSALKVALAAFGATFPLLFQASYGIADIDPVARDTARAFGLGFRARLRHLVLPTMMPYLATGFRLSAAVALILVITGEYIVGVPGLGREVLANQSAGAYSRMYGLIITAGLLGLAVNIGLQAAERRILRWHPSQRARFEGGAA